MKNRQRHGWKKWWIDESAVAAMEAVLIFPVMIIMIFGIMDIGNGLLINKKLISASQVASDLIGRQLTVTDSDINDIVIAARLSLQPFSTDSFGIDIAGIRFDPDSGDPAEEWRDTVGMAPNGDAVASAAGLGDPGEGVVAVTVQYTYEPYFSGYFINTINMQEISYVRGRKSSFVARED